MREFTELELKQLGEMKYLEKDGHPSVKAYKNVLTSLSADCSLLAIVVEEHGRDCPICKHRYYKALDELYPNS